MLSVYDRAYMTNHQINSSHVTAPSSDKKQTNRNDICRKFKASTVTAPLCEARSKIRRLGNLYTLNFCAPDCNIKIIKSCMNVNPIFFLQFSLLACQTSFVSATFWKWDFFLWMCSARSVCHNKTRVFTFASITSFLYDISRFFHNLAITLGHFMRFNARFLGGKVCCCFTTALSLNFDCDSEEERQWFSGKLK